MMTVFSACVRSLLRGGGRPSSWAQLRSLSAGEGGPRMDPATTCPEHPPRSAVNHPDPHLLQLRSLERSFKKRLRAAHLRFSDVPDNTVVQGRNYVYFIEGGGIYRMDTRQVDPDAEEVLSWDSVGEGDWSLQRVRLSPREKLLAATLKTPQGEEARCVLVRLGGHTPPDPPPPLLTLDKVFSFEWATDDVLFFTSQEGLQCHRVFRLDLSSPGTRRTLMYEETQPDVFVEVSLSRDRKLVTVNCSSKTSSEVWLIDTATPLTEPRLVQPRLPGLLYHVEHSQNQLCILANTGPHQEYQVLRAPLTSPSMENWVPVCRPAPGTAVKDMEVVPVCRPAPGTAVKDMEVVPVCRPAPGTAVKDMEVVPVCRPAPGTAVEDMEVVQDQCVLSIRDPGGLLGLLVVPLAHPENTHTLQLPPWACAVQPSRAGLGESSALDLLLSSPVHPPVHYRYTPGGGRLLLHTDPREDRTPQDYHTTRLETPSQDGTMVPLTLFHAAPLEGLRGAPLLVQVYGAYGRDLDMTFSPESRLLLEDGWALAYCHVRGGGERGLAWHRGGRLQGKQRGVEDLAACLTRLSSLGVSQPPRTALSARSAGAVLVGALCNQLPHLVRAVTLQAPFLDVLGTMQDPSLPLTLEERGEWGDPLADPLHRDAIASYCPCHNITPQRYPSMLLTAYRDDVRVPLAGVHKYVERLRTAIHTHLTVRPVSEPEPTPTVILDVQPGADHFGPEDFDLSLTESARQLAFLYRELGLVPDHQKTPRHRRR